MPDPRAALPRSVLDRADVRAALMHRDFGRVFAIAKELTQGKISYSAIAESCDIPPDRVGKLARGQGSITTFTKVLDIADGLRIPGHLLGLLPRPWESPQVSAGSEPVIPRPQEQDVGECAVDVLHGELERLATTYVHAPLPGLMHSITDLRSQTVELLDLVRPRLRHRLRAIATAASLLEAHGAQNLGQTSRAAVHLAAAARSASDSGMPALRAATYNTAALICEWIPGQEEAAVRHAAAAYTLLPRGATGVRAAAIQARAAARRGDRDTALQALGRLERAREAPTHPEDLGVTVGGLFDFVEAKTAFYTGGAYRLLGQMHDANTHTRRALDLYDAAPPDQRSYGDEAIARVDLVGTLVASGADEEAIIYVHKLVELPKDMRIQQLYPALTELGRYLSRRSSVSRPTRAIVELVNDFTMDAR